MTRHEFAIREAYGRGYRATDEGVIVGLRGRPLRISLSGKQVYPTFSVRLSDGIGSSIFGIMAHKFAAFCFHGEAVFASPAPVVRHKNGQVMDISRANILLGTYADNEADKSPSARSRVGAIARSFQPKHGVTGKLTPEAIAEIKLVYAHHPRRVPNGVASALAEKFGVDKNAIANAARGKTWA